jgi:hypothetical protein
MPLFLYLYQMAKLIPVKPNSVFNANGRVIELAKASQDTLKKIQAFAPHLVREDKKQKNADIATESSESDGTANAI